MCYTTQLCRLLVPLLNRVNWCKINKTLPYMLIKMEEGKGNTFTRPVHPTVWPCWSLGTPPNRDIQWGSICYTTQPCRLLIPLLNGVTKEPNKKTMRTLLPVASLVGDGWWEEEPAECQSFQLLNIQSCDCILTIRWPWMPFVYQSEISLTEKMLCYIMICQYQNESRSISFFWVIWTMNYWHGLWQYMVPLKLEMGYGMKILRKLTVDKTDLT